MAMRVKKFVLDPNIYISYFISQNHYLLVEVIAKNKLTFFICEELLEELERVLNYKRLAKYDIDIYEAVQFVKTIGINTELIYPIKCYVPKDKNDDYIIALALQTTSGFITSGDNDVLSEKENLERKFKKLKILTKTEFEKMFAVYSNEY